MARLGARATWPNRFFSHCATSNGLTGNDGFIDAPTPYPALAEAGYTYNNYFHSLFFAATITSLRGQLNALKQHVFFEQAAAGTLPNLSIVEPSFFLNDDHPPSDVRLGQAFLATVYEALRTSPCWPRTLMVVFYDEHGGFFDHAVPPPSAGDAIGGPFARLGFRVPGLVIGPLVKRGFVLDSVVDHASVPSLISNLFEIPHVNERSRLAGDLGEALSLELVLGANRPTPPALAPIDIPVAVLERALRADSGQPELQRWMRQAGRAHHDSLPERRRMMRRYLALTRRLDTVRYY